jgi:hypothetical protein
MTQSSAGKVQSELECARKLDRIAIKGFFRKNAMPPVEMFEYDYRITAQRLDNSRSPIWGSALQFHDLFDFREDLFEQMGRGRYRIWVKFRNPAQEKWQLVRIDDYSVS